jgi:ubiquinone/menaquinone biosynthesis C-methylase UbiE
VDSVIKEYRRLARHYDQQFFHYNAKTINATTQFVKDINDKTVLDIGCGTGIFLKLLSSHYPLAELTGVDIVDNMLHIARQKLPDSVALIEASACHLPVSDNSVDLITSTSALHYFPDQELALREMLRVLKPTGELIITDWCYDFFSNRILDIYLKAIGKGHYHMLGSKGLHDRLQQADAENIELHTFKINWLWGIMTARARKPA